MANVNDTITDGSTVWTVRQGNLGLDGFKSGQLISNLDHTIKPTDNTSYLQIFGGATGSKSAYLRIFGNNYGDSNLGTFNLQAGDGVTYTNMVGTPNGTLKWGTNDLAGSAIAAKSLDTNGYIKYASGLIEQFSTVRLDGASGTDLRHASVTFPITFPTKYTSVVISVLATDGYSTGYTINYYLFNVSKSGFIIQYKKGQASGTYYVTYVATGY